MASTAGFSAAVRRTSAAWIGWRTLLCSGSSIQPMPLLRSPGRFMFAGLNCLISEPSSAWSASFHWLGSLSQARASAMRVSTKVRVAGSR